MPRPRTSAEGLPRERHLVRLLWIVVLIYVAGLAGVFVLLLESPRRPEASLAEDSPQEPGPIWDATAQGAKIADLPRDLPALGDPVATVTRPVSSAGIDAEGALAPPIAGAPVAPLRPVRCWTVDGTEKAGSQCQTLLGGGQVASSLSAALETCCLAADAVRSCRSAVFGVEVDLERRRVSVWVEPGLALLRADEVLACVKSQSLTTPAPESEEVRYHFTHRLPAPQARPVDVARALPRSEDSLAPAAEPAPPGRLAAVMKDKVRVRREPSEGSEIIGKISPPAQVVVLETQGDWCRVFTPNRREGWMVCWALSPDGAGAP